MWSMSGQSEKKLERQSGGPSQLRKHRGRGRGGGRGREEACSPVKILNWKSLQLLEMHLKIISCIFYFIYLFIYYFILFYVVQYSIVWYGIVWYGMVWYGMVWYSIVQNLYNIKSIGTPTFWQCLHIRYKHGGYSPYRHPSYQSTCSLDNNVHSCVNHVSVHYKNDKKDGKN